MRISVHKIGDPHAHAARIHLHIKPLRLGHCDAGDDAHIAIAPVDVFNPLLRPSAREEVAADPCIA